MISKGQIRLIHLAKDALGLSHEDYKEMLVLYGGADSSKDLTPEGFFKVMERMRELGFGNRDTALFGPAKRAQEHGIVVEMATPGQRAKIRQLEAELGWAENPERLKGFIKKRLGMTSIATKTQAIAVIEALKAMLTRERPTGTGT